MQSDRLILLVVFAILSATAAKNLYKPRIVNGQNAKEGQFPHMVSLRSNVLGGQHGCGASILSDRFLLTAAHCCQGPHAIPQNMFAVVGALRLSSGGVKVNLDRISAHKGFDKSNMSSSIHDVCVIRTATNINFTDLIQPIALPKENLPEDRGTQVVLSGWGRHKFPWFDIPDILQFSEFETITSDECATRFVNVPVFRDAIRKESLCAIDKKNGEGSGNPNATGACHGDSGKIYNYEINYERNNFMIKCGFCFSKLGGGLIDVTDPNHKTIVGIASWVYPVIFSFHFRIYCNLYN